MPFVGLGMVARGVLVATALAVPSATLLVGPASAQAGESAECTAAVQDTAGVLTDAERGVLGAAADAFVGPDGSDPVVRVRVLEGLEGRSPRGYVDDQVAACPSWAGPSGGRNPLLLALVVSVGDRETGIYYGAGFDGIAGDEHAVQTDVMNPRFAAGDVAGGLLAGLHALEALAAQPPAPPPPPTTRPAPPPPTGGPSQQPDPAVSTPSSSSDGSAAPLVALLVVGLAATFGGIGLPAFRSRRDRDRRHRQRADRLVAARTEASHTVARLTSTWPEVDHRALVTSGDWGEQDSAWFGPRRAAVTARVDQVVADLADLPSVEQLRAADADALDGWRVAIDAWQRAAAEVEQEVASFEAEVTRVDALPGAWDHRRAELDAVLGAVRGMSDRLTADGLPVDGAGELAALDRARDAAVADAAAGSWARVDTQAAAVEEAAATLSSTLDAVLTAWDAHGAAVAELSADAAAARRAADVALPVLRDAAERWDAAAVDRFTAPLDEAGVVLTASLDRLVACSEARSFEADAFAAAESDARRAVRDLTGAAAQGTEVEAILQQKLDEAQHLADEALAHLERTRAHRHRRGLAEAEVAWGAWEAARRAHRVDPFELVDLAGAAASSAEASWRASEAAEAADRRSDSRSALFGAGALSLFGRSGRSSPFGFGGGSHGGGSSNPFDGGGGGSSSSWGGGGGSSSGGGGGGSSSSW